jgi:hypothetical protein
MTLAQFFEKVYPLLLDKTMERVEKQLDDGTEIKAYWCGAIIRIDIKPVKR